MERTIIRGCTLVTLDPAHRVLTNGELEMNSSTGTVSYVGARRDSHPEARAVIDRGAHVVDGTGQIALPGLVNMHAHSPMAIMRYLNPSVGLFPWLQQVWAIENQLTSEQITVALRLALCEMIFAGITTAADMYFYGHDQLQAALDSGVRIAAAPTLFGPGVSPYHKAHPMATVANVIDMAKMWNGPQGLGQGRVSVMLGPHAIYTCSSSLLQEAAMQAAQHGVGIHIHVSETRQEVEDCVATYGCTPVELLELLGFFEGPGPIIVAHGVHLTPHDIEILAGYAQVARQASTPGVVVAHCPSSNHFLRCGTAPVGEMLAQGIPVGVGTDSVASNGGHLSIFQQAHLATNSVTAPQALQLATRADSLGLAGGTLAQGQAADVILISARGLNMLPLRDPVQQLFAAQPGDIQSMWVGGSVVMYERQLTTMDVDKVAADARALDVQLHRGLTTLRSAVTLNV